MNDAAEPGEWLRSWAGDREPVRVAVVAGRRAGLFAGVQRRRAGVVNRARLGSAALRTVAVANRLSNQVSSTGLLVNGDIVVFTGTARRAKDIPPPHENPAYLAKHGDSLLRVSHSAEEFGKKFPVPLRIEIARTRGR